MSRSLTIFSNSRSFNVSIAFNKIGGVVKKNKVTTKNVLIIVVFHVLLVDVSDKFSLKYEPSIKKNLYSVYHCHPHSRLPKYILRRWREFNRPQMRL